MLTAESADWLSQPRPPLKVLNIGHRGASGQAPENTMAAFELALRQGADGIEFDVHLSADGVPVVIHDARLDRTTSGSGRVGEHRAHALRRLDAGTWFNRRYPSKARSFYVGRRIPLLAEVLEWVRKRNCWAFVEIKGGGYPGIESKVVAAIERAGVAARSRIISFDVPTLRRVREAGSRIPLGLDVTRPLLAIRRAESVGASNLLSHWAFTSRRLIRRAHEAGLRVLVWNLNQSRWMRRRIADGVDGIVTNYPDRLVEVCQTLPSSADNSATD